MRYVEFAVTSNFSFLRGASHPEEMLAQAAHLGMAGMGLCDRNSVAGVVRAHLLKRETKLALRYHPGARLVFTDGTPDILAYPRDRAAWGRLCRLLTTGNLRAEKGHCTLSIEDLLAHIDGLELIVMEKSTNDFSSTAVSLLSPPPAHSSPPPFREREKKEQRGRKGVCSVVPNLLSRLNDAAPGRVRLATSMLYRGNDRARLAALSGIARAACVPLIAVNDVLYHVPARRKLQDVVTCIREHMTIEAAGRKLGVNAERHLKSPEEMARLFRDAPEAVIETMRLSMKLTFSLDELAFEYPEETREGFTTPQDALVHYTYEGAADRYPGGIPDKVCKSLAHELALIDQLQYAPYFLTVHDIVRFARSRNILCQGRGSAANSAVCYCLDVTEVDPEHSDLLFERFISASRREPPDIDVDFEHERREEVIQYIYSRYGRDRAGLAATVISYRGRSAMREVGKVFGISEDAINAIGSTMWGSSSNFKEADLGRAGLSRKTARVRKMLEMVEEIAGFPRHLSQHVGGFVMTRGRLDEVVPIGNAAMEKRTCVEWDKDDLDALRILKVDVLGLGMLTCLRKAFDLLEKHYPRALSLPSPLAGESLPSGSDPGVARRSPKGEGVAGGGSSISAAQVPAPTLTLPRKRGREKEKQGTREESTALSQSTRTLSAIPAGDPAVYRMLQRADSLGVFQVESRAQMSMLPRLKPKEFYDLVVEVAIVRPGPIQGDMVHPYLRRRQGIEPVSYPSEELKAVLGKTLGVPLFQEQAMQIAIVAAGFTPEEADRLRRAMATFRRVGTIGTFQKKMIEGMAAKGYARDFAERCFHQIEGFGEYGFPESHAASFALLVYASSWFKCHYPDVFAAALLNAQPMGFYAPAQIVRDVREHGVAVRHTDINHSDWEATLEPGPRAAERLHSLHATMRDDVHSTHAIRLGFREIKGIREEEAKLIVERRRTPLSPATRHFAPLPPREAWRGGFGGGGQRLDVNQESPPTPTASPPTLPAARKSSRGEGNYDSVRDVWLRTGLPLRVLERLADADAFASLGLSRREALWAVKILDRAGDHDDLPLFLGRDARAREPDVHLPPMPPGEEVVNDYRFLKLSLRAHPAEFLRKDLDRREILKNEFLRTLKTGAYVRVSGLVTCRQRPGSASGVIFMTIEDETSIANIIVWPKILERFRPVVLGTRYVSVTGQMQEECGVIHVVADRLEDLSFLLGRLSEAADPAQDLDVPARATRHALSRKLAS